jgi:hypothetical protein
MAFATASKYASTTSSDQSGAFRQSFPVTGLLNSLVAEDTTVIRLKIQID